ncbi:MAG: phage tail sheath family protein [Succinivibrio sp.]|nr:phage tail sheath family protein [Succinivibrio sp.]
MSNYRHGVYTSETATTLIPTVDVESAIPLVVGTAPVNQIDKPQINKPVLINSYSEAVEAFGFQDAVAGADGKKHFAYTLSEFMKAHFTLYATVPVVIVNVLDPSKHRAAFDAEVDLTSGSATVEQSGIIASTVKLTRIIPAKDGAEAQTLTFEAGADYELAFDTDGYPVINVLKDAQGDYKITGTVSVSGYKLDPAKVTKADIIGGVDKDTLNNKGLECIADVFPQLRLVPTLLLAPGFSSDPEVALVMAAKVDLINGHFKAMALVDAPAREGSVRYSDIPAWKNNKGVTAAQTIVCWPNVLVGETVYHPSVHLAGIIGVTDAARGSVPYVSPSNKSAGITGLCLEDGTEVTLGMEQGNYLNGQGILTFNNFNNGWKAWGNRTATYPGVTDPKDAFIPVRRMFQWVSNTIILTMWQKVDEPGNRRLVDSVVDSLNVWLNALSADGQLLGGRIEFREDDNPTTDLMDGRYNFKVYLTPPSPAEELHFDLEIDTAYYSNLFTSAE